MQQRPDHSKRRAMMWLRRGAISAGALIVLLAAVVFAAGTGPVLRALTPMINDLVSEGLGGTFVIAKPQGNLWTGLHIDSLLMEDPATGLHIEGDNFEFIWSPGALLRGTLGIDRIAASRLSVVLPDQTAPETVEGDGDSGPFVLPLSIRVGQLDLPEIHIVNPADGRIFSYRLSADGAALADGSARLALELDPLDGGIDHVSAKMDYDPARRDLNIDLAGRLDRGGVVMTLAGMAPEDAPDITFSLVGDGPADQWQGQLDFTASDLASLTGQLGVQVTTPDIGFDFTGIAATGGNLAQQVPVEIQGDIDLAIVGSYGMDDSQLAISKFDIIKAGLLNLSAQAGIDFDRETLDARMDAMLDPAASALLDGNVAWQAANLSVQASGPLAAPDVTASLTAQTLTTPVSEIAQLDLAATMKAVGGRFVIDAGATTAGHVWQDDGLGAMLGDHQNITVQIDLAGDGSDSQMPSVMIAAPGMTVTGHATLDDAGNVTQGNIIADAADLAIFSVISGLDLSGQGRVGIEDIVWNADNGGAARLAITAQEAGFGLADLDRVIGPQPVIAGQAKISPQFDLEIDFDRIGLAAVDGSGSVGISNNFSDLSANINLVLSPSIIPAGIGATTSQPAQLNAAIAGPMAAPAGQVKLTLPGLNVSGEDFRRISLTTDMAWSDAGILRLDHRAGFTLRDQPYTARATVSLPDDGVGVSAIGLAGEGIEISGEIALPDYSTPLSGRIVVDRLDVGLLSAWGVPFEAGTIMGDIGFVPDQTRQTVTLAADAAGLRLAMAEGDETPGRIEKIALSGEVRDAFDNPALALRLDGSEIVVAPVQLDTIGITLDGVLSELAVTAQLAGRMQDDIALRLDSAAMVGLGDDIQVRLDRFDAGVGAQKIALREPALFRQTARGAQEASLALAVGSGQIDAQLRHSPLQQFTASLDIAGLALGPWGEMFDIKGMDGNLVLNGDVSEQAGQMAEARMEGRISDIRINAAGNLPPLELVLNSILANGRVESALSLGRPDLDVLTASGSLPVAFSALRGEFAPVRDAPLTLDADIDGQIEDFWPYVPLPDHALSGRIRLDFSAQGTLEQPDWNGILRLEDGRYEHLQYGTLLAAINLDGRFDDRGLIIPSITATDGGNGTVSGKAEVRLDDDPALAYEAELTLRNAAMARMDEVKVWTDMDMAVTGDDTRADITGQITLQRGEIDLNVALPASVSQLEIDNLQQGAAAEDAKDTPDAFASALDVRVSIPGRLFVRGKGLESEWGGNLAISGPADDPIIVGELRALRGQLDVIGKTFVIRDSTITFSGAQPPDPLLDIAGVYSTDDLIVTAAFKGLASDPELVLTSEPSLPQDEILSRVLFGKSQGSLSAIEAVQLASAASELSGGGGGLDVVGSIRKFVGVDVLQVGGGDDGPNVRVGQYLADGVYVGTKQGTTPGSSGVEVEIELTPNIKVTSETGAADTKAGIQFKLDY
ncbi:MAG: translocation/assembly module TamB domain-containing protein [Pseudomonadota bacterium]